MDIIKKLKCGIRRGDTRVVYPEGEEPEILKAAYKVLTDGVAIPVLIGKAGKIKEIAETLQIHIAGMEMIDPADARGMDGYVDEYAHTSPLSAPVIKKILEKRVAFANMMVRMGDADIVVAGIAHATEEVIMAAQLVIGMQPGISAPSSFMLMDVPGYRGEEGSLLVYADASVNPDPTPDELARIAVMTAENVKNILGWEPRVAMLSFSTCGSASHSHVEKVLSALAIARSLAPELAIDGEFQFDTAIVKSVAEKKMRRESTVAGRANVLIFPDLDAANIAYKITQRLAGAAAYGMVLQGFAKPVSDLSRGAAAKDVYGLTVMQVAGLLGKKENNQS